MRLSVSSTASNRAFEDRPYSPGVRARAAVLGICIAIACAGGCPPVPRRTPTRRSSAGSGPGWTSTTAGSIALRRRPQQESRLGTSRRSGWRSARRPRVRGRGQGATARTFRGGVALTRRQGCRVVPPGPCRPCAGHATLGRCSASALGTARRSTASSRTSRERLEGARVCARAEPFLSPAACGRRPGRTRWRSSPSTLVGSNAVRVRGRASRGLSWPRSPTPSRRWRTPVAPSRGSTRHMDM